MCFALTVLSFIESEGDMTLISVTKLFSVLEQSLQHQQKHPKKFAGKENKKRDPEKNDTSEFNITQKSFCVLVEQTLRENRQFILMSEIGKIK